MPSTLSNQSRSMERKVTIIPASAVAAAWAGIFGGPVPAHDPIRRTWITRTEAAAVVAHGNRCGYPETSPRAASDAAIVETVKVRFTATPVVPPVVDTDHGEDADTDHGEPYAADAFYTDGGRY